MERVAVAPPLRGVRGQPEAHRHARVGRVLLVALRHLVAGEARLAARAVRGDAEVAEDEAALPQPLEDPPPGLDVLAGVGDVGVVHVDPEADALREPLELPHVAEDRLLALLVEGLDAVRLDVLLRLQAQLALDLQLHGQALRVPAALARHTTAAHRLVARDQVLEHPRLHVVDAGVAVGRGRALEEGEDRILRPLLHGTAEDLLPLPELQHLPLPVEVRDARGDGIEGRHGGTPFASRRPPVGARHSRTARIAGPRRPCAGRENTRPAVRDGRRRTDRRDARGTTRVARRPLEAEDAARRSPRCGCGLPDSRRWPLSIALPLLTVGVPAEPTGRAALGRPRSCTALGRRLRSDVHPAWHASGSHRPGLAERSVSPLEGFNSRRALRSPSSPVGVV